MKKVANKLRKTIVFASMVLMFFNFSCNKSGDDFDDDHNNADDITDKTGIFQDAPSYGFVYTANYNSNDISAFIIDTSSGSLAQIDADSALDGIQNYAAGINPASLAVDSGLKFLYAANFNSNDISVYTIGSDTGVLTAVDADSALEGIQNFAAGTNPRSVVIDSTGKYLFVANGGSNDISVFVIDSASGALTPVDADSVLDGIQNFPAGTNPVSITINSSGQYLYAANFNSNDISAFSFDLATGVLTQIDADAEAADIQNFAAGFIYRSVSIAPNGKFLYATNKSANAISAFLIDSSTGSLTQIDAIADVAEDTTTTGIQNFTASSGPVLVSVAKDGKYVYAINALSDNISAFLLDDVTGIISSIDADAISEGIQHFRAGDNPVSMSIDNSGLFAFVSNSGSNDISAFVIHPDSGILIPVDADESLLGTQNFDTGNKPMSIVAISK
ncbi:MAG: lactonase family protein [Spirochaetia bacterium]|nr:lactonase family protein [Spirochaetia bacterium]